MNKIVSLFLLLTFFVTSSCSKSQDNQEDSNEELTQEIIELEKRTVELGESLDRLQVEMERSDSIIQSMQNLNSK